MNIQNQVNPLMAPHAKYEKVHGVVLHTTRYIILEIIERVNDLEHNLTKSGMLFKSNLSQRIGRNTLATLNGQ